MVERQSETQELAENDAEDASQSNREVDETSQSEEHPERQEYTAEKT